MKYLRLKILGLSILWLAGAVLFTPLPVFARRVKTDVDNYLTREEEDRLISDIEPQGWFIERIREKSRDIPRLIELPLREAIEILYDKNISTTRCSANRTDINYGFAYIEGELNSLSEENRAVLNRIKEEGAAEVEGLYFMLKVPVSASTTVEEIRKMFIALANRFLMQQPIWIEKERYSRERFKERYSIKDDTDIIRMAEELGYYYDPESGFIYYSQEHCIKVQSYRTD